MKKLAPEQKASRYDLLKAGTVGVLVGMVVMVTVQRVTLSPGASGAVGKVGSVLAWVTSIDVNTDDPPAPAEPDVALEAAVTP